MSGRMGEVFAGPGFRVCSRSACRWPAVATLSFDYSRKQVWLDDLRPGPDPSSYDLCAVHAERFAAPSRWGFEDRRPVIHQPAEVSESSADREPEKVETLHRAASSSDSEKHPKTAKRAGRRNS